MRANPVDSGLGLGFRIRGSSDIRPCLVNDGMTTCLVEFLGPDEKVRFVELSLSTSEDVTLAMSCTYTDERCIL